MSEENDRAILIGPKGIKEPGSDAEKGDIIVAWGWGTAPYVSQVVEPFKAGEMLWIKKIRPLNLDDWLESDRALLPEPYNLKGDA